MSEPTITEPTITESTMSKQTMTADATASSENAAAAQAQLAALRDAVRQEFADQVAALQQERDAAAQALAEERLSRLRLDAALQHGLPPDLADRLRGDNAAELSQDAARVAAMLPTRQPRRVGHSAQQDATRAQQIYQRIGGGDQDAFAVLLQKGMGGGAFNS